MCKQLKRVIFFLPDKQFVCCLVVVVAHEVQNSVNHNTRQLNRKIGLKGLGIFRNPLNTNVNVALYGVGFFGLVEGNNIGVGIVLEVGFVDVQQISITTKNIIECAQFFTFLLYHQFKPLAVL